MQHGMIDSADCFIMNRPEKAPAFMLVDAGYDVWLGNTRGNKYSLKHISLSFEQKEYWDFSFDEMAFYDVPAFIEFIRN